MTWIYKYQENARVVEDPNHLGQLLHYNYTVGYYDPSGFWQISCYYLTEEEAWAQTSYLNGGSNPGYAATMATAAMAQGTTYDLTADKNTMFEGDQVCFTLNTTGMAQGSTVSWYITGQIVQADIQSPGAMSGDFIVNNNTSSYCMYLVNDLVTEGLESFTLQLTNGADSATVTVDDLSIYGCTDSTASNYDPTATIDDGSCTYASSDPKRE